MFVQCTSFSCIEFFRVNHFEIFIGSLESDQIFVSNRDEDQSRGEGGKKERGRGKNKNREALPRSLLSLLSFCPPSFLLSSERSLGGNPNTAGMLSLYCISSIPLVNLIGCRPSVSQRRSVCFPSSYFCLFHIFKKILQVLLYVSDSDSNKSCFCKEWKKNKT